MNNGFVGSNQNSATEAVKYQVCPLLMNCCRFHDCNQPELSYLRYIIQFCGNQFVQCQHYQARRADQDKHSGSTSLAEHAPRAGPT